MPGTLNVVMSQHCQYVRWSGPAACLCT